MLHAQHARNGTIITASRVVSLGLVSTHDSREVSGDWLADYSLPRLHRWN